MAKIIEFKPKELNLKKLREYADNLDLFFEENEKAVSILQEYFKYADDALKIKVVLLLGSFAKERSGEFCYRTAMDKKEDEMVRDAAALQLGHLLRNTNDREELVERLLNDVGSKEKDRRIYAVRALGFEGNHEAALPLLGLLYDPDTVIQQCAVNAISNLRDPNVVTILKDQLKSASKEKTMTILFNLWRFEGRRKEIIPIYLKYVQGKDLDLRFHALLLLGYIADVEEHLDVYSGLIQDRDKRVRRIVAEKLGESGKKEVKTLLSRMVDDEDMEVKRAAVKALKNL